MIVTTVTIAMTQAEFDELSRTVGKIRQSSAERRLRALMGTATRADIELTDGEGAKRPYVRHRFGYEWSRDEALHPVDTLEVWTETASAVSPE